MIDIKEHGKDYIVHKCNKCGCTFGFSRKDVVSSKYEVSPLYTHSDDWEMKKFISSAWVTCPECGEKYIVTSYNSKQDSTKEGKIVVCKELEKIPEDERWRWIAI